MANRNRTTRLKLVLMAIGLASIPLTGGLATAQSTSAYFYDVRSIYTAPTGVSSPVGIAYVSISRGFFVFGAMKGGQTAATMAGVPFYNQPNSASRPSAISDPLNVTFSLRNSQYWSYERSTSSLVSYRTQTDGSPGSQPTVRFDLRALGIQNLQGMTIDPSSGDLFMLDAVGPRVIRIKADAQGNPNPTATGSVSQVNLRGLGTGTWRGIAFNANNGHLYLMNVPSSKLYEITAAGALVSTRTLTSIHIVSPQALVFGPSAQESDNPATQDLNIVDGGDGAHPGRIVELSLTAQVIAPQYAAVTAGVTLVNTVQTWQWNPPSPDPAGVAFQSSSGRLFVSDSEVEEFTQPYWHGVNMWESTLGGILERTFTTFTKNPTNGTWNNYSNEPTGLAFNPNNGHLFVSDDTLERVWELDSGADQKFGTADDVITFINTGAFGDKDTEDVAYAHGKLYVTYGFNKSIFVVDSGPNGRFDGIPPTGDDSVSQFDVGAFGVRDAEGLGYDPVSDHLFVVDKNRYLVEVTRGGAFVRSIDLKFLNPVTMADVEFAPSSSDPTVESAYIVDRMVDNNTNPNENDGRMYEISLGGAVPTPTFTATPLPATETPTPMPGTNTPTPLPATSTPTHTPAPATNTPTPLPATSTPTNTPTSAPLPTNTPTPVATATPTSTSAPANRLANPGFEIDADGDGLPDSWSTWPKFTRSSAVVHSGSFAGQFLDSNDNNATITQLVTPVLPGTAYNFSGWVNIPPTTDVFTFTFQVRWFNVTGGTISTTTVKTYSGPTNGWDQTTAALVSPAGTAAAQVRMSVSSLAAAIYVDDMSFGR